MPETKTGEQKYKERQKWFIDRIGKRVYRNKGTCECKVCKCVEETGLIISDETHAYYLNDCSFELGLQYRDNKKTSV